jgi:hypothetical protein
LAAQIFGIVLYGVHQVRERDLLDVAKSDRFADFRQRDSAKSLIARNDGRAARQYLAAVVSYDPIANSFDDRIGLVVVARNVLAADIGQKFLVSVWLLIEDHADFLPVMPVSKALATQEQPQLERHIEARQFIDRIELGARNVVDAEFAARDNPNDFVHSNLPAVRDFQGTARREPAIYDGEDRRMEEAPVLEIKGTVDENALIVRTLA